MVPIFVGLVANKMHPVNSAFERGAGLNLIQEDLVEAG